MLVAGEDLTKDIMKKITITALTLGASLMLGTLAMADEITFTSLPQPVQTTVMRETHIAGPSGVTRVIRETNGVYAVTVHQDTGNRVVYIDQGGTLVQSPDQGTVTTTTREEPQTVVTYDQLQQTPNRYELIKKEGHKEIYLDHQTGQRVKVERKD
jgi:hypothetical protein